MQTTLLNTYPPNLIATILNVLREQNDQLNEVEETAGPVPEIVVEDDQILKDGGGFWDDFNGGYLPGDLVLAARREEIAWVHSEGVCEIVPMPECEDAVGSDLGGHRQVCGPRSQENSIETLCQGIQKRRSKAKFKELCLLLRCSLQCHLLKL